jgi:3-phytase
MKYCIIFLFLLLASATIVPAQDSPIVELSAAVETEPSPGDGATSPLVWLHPDDLSQSLIIGTDDNTGIGVYDLEGRLLQFETDYGAVGGADIRYGFGSRSTLIVGAAKDEARLLFFTVERESRTLISLGNIETGIRLQGVCLYHSPLTSTFYAIAFSEFGEIEQYALIEDDGEIQAQLARAIDVGGELEHCAVDDSLRRLYLSEGENLVWRYGTEPEDGIRRSIVDISGGHIDDEIEGLAVYTMADNQGYLIVTNEAVDSLLVYERTGDNEFVGEFKIVAGEDTDAVSEPGGVTVTGLSLGERFPQGVFVTTDDVNSAPNADNNFKLVSWEAIATGLALDVDTTYDPRALELRASTDFATVTAMLETAPVDAATDAADDPAIWVHPVDPALSLIVGSDKRNGLVVYDLDGNITQTISIGRVNNVDVRGDFVLDGQSVGLVVATNRSENSLEINAVDPQSRQLVDVAASPVISDVEEVYGVCMYVSADTGTTYAFVNSADTGEVEQYELTAAGARVEATQVRTFVVGSQTEGCVADDENGVVFIGEEAVGLWAYGAEPDDDDSRTLIDSTNADGHLTADVEGVTLYAGPNGQGYIIVSSQGSNEFVVYDRQGNHEYVGTFRIVETDIIDAVSGTDGLDVTSLALGDTFPDGLLVVQDDLNINPSATQNFKLISWGDIAMALGIEVYGQ